MFCFAPIDGWRAVFAGGEALGNVRHGVRAESLRLKFIRIPPNKTPRRRPPLYITCPLGRETPLLYGFHACILFNPRRKIGVPLNICEITVVEGAFSCFEILSR